jgi:hypothetical protein
MFLFFDDPEGPNLLIVMGMAGLIYFLSLAVYMFKFPITGLKMLLLAIFIQIIIVTPLSIFG